MIKRLSYKIKRIKSELDLLCFLIRNYKVAKRISKSSVLSEENQKDYSAQTCPICNSNDMHVFASFPVNISTGQKHSLLYYDYAQNDINTLKNKRVLLDKTLGFFVSVTWNFCDNCLNGSLSTQFKPDHLIKYYADCYKRVKATDKQRINTKVLYAKYLTRLLSPRSNLLELGSAEGIAAECLAKLGHNVYVYEPCEEFSALLRKSRSITYINDYSTLTDTFDVICLHHVLEHIADPISYIKTLIPLLKKDGYIFIQVPDLSLQIGIMKRVLRKSIYPLFNKPYFYFDKIKYQMSASSIEWFDALANDHISAFTSEGLAYILNESGCRLKTMIQSTEDRITYEYDSSKYAWPVDEETGNTPNGLTVIAQKN